MKAITIIGRLTKDGEVQQAERGEFVKFSVAVDDGYGDKKSTVFFDVAYFRAQIAPYLKKGTTVGVTGELKTREYNGKTYLSVRPSDVKLLGGKRSSEETSSGQGDYNSGNAGDMDDEIPF
jgi:single-strand DNA-binding protein